MLALDDDRVHPSTFFLAVVIDNLFLHVVVICIFRGFFKLKVVFVLYSKAIPHRDNRSPDQTFRAHLKNELTWVNRSQVYFCRPVLTFRKEVTAGYPAAFYDCKVR